MKGIILAGGTGTRLEPLTKVVNKHILPIGKYPMIYYSVTMLTEAGISDILVVTGADAISDIARLLGSGEYFGCDFSYKIQDKPGGIAQALMLGESFVFDDDVAVILGDNLFLGDNLPKLDFNTEKTQCKLFFKEVENPCNFGVPEFDKNGNLLKIIEKPTSPPSTYAVTGLYVYTSNILFDILNSIKPSKRGEYEISDVNSEYISLGLCEYEHVECDWIDAGTHENYTLANKLINKIKKGV